MRANVGYQSIHCYFTVTWRGNVAFGRHTKQSSTRGEFSSDRAVDGNMEKGSCSQTTGKEAPWWRVVLDGVYDIKMVAIRACQGCKSCNYYVPKYISRQWTLF